MISDIHGNAEALAAILGSARYKGVERLLCSGDIIGYYYEPHKCLDLLSEWELDCVRGNHEEMFLRLLGDSSCSEGIRKKYGSALSMVSDLLTKEQLNYLLHLPVKKTLKIHDKTILLCHGAPWDGDYYVYPDADIEIFQRCAESGADYVVLGHTHYQLSIRYGKTFIINPGAVGQPRGIYRGVAHWAVLDPDTGWFEHQAVKYDPSVVIAQARKHDPDVLYLQNILMRSLEQ